MTENEKDYYISDHDSKNFGFKVARITNNIISPELTVQELKSLSAKLIIARVDLEKIQLINQLERIGFTYKAASATFSFKLSSNLPNYSNDAFILTKYDRRHFDQIVNITKVAFKNYGHYYANERLNEKKCNEVYVDLIFRCCNEKDVADGIIVAEKGGNAIGYLAYKKYNTFQEQYMIGIIGAVDPEYRSQGVFREINIKSLYLAKDMGMHRMENDVLLTNFPVMKTYTNLSYNIVRSVMTMHYWNE